MAQWGNLSIWRTVVNPQNPHLKQNASVKPAVLQQEGRQRQEPQVNTPKPDRLEYIASQQKQERPWLNEMGGERHVHICAQVQS